MSVRNQFNRDRVSFIAFFFLYYGTTAFTVVFMPRNTGQNSAAGGSAGPIGGFLLRHYSGVPVGFILSDRSGRGLGLLKRGARVQPLFAEGRGVFGLSQILTAVGAAIPVENRLWDF